jgi:hypothetical protein
MILIRLFGFIAQGALQKLNLPVDERITGLFRGGSGMERYEKAVRVKAVRVKVLLVILCMASILLNVHLYSENRALRDQVTIVRNQINTRRGVGSTCTLFITPHDPLVEDTVYRVTGRSRMNASVHEIWEDYEKMYDWVRENIYYSKDTPLLIISEGFDAPQWGDEYWRFPNETITDGCGDCEDMATLLASMIMCYSDESYGCWVISCSNGSLAHMAVAFPVAEGEVSILDPAGNFYTSNWYPYTLTSKPGSIAVDEWLQHCSRNDELRVNKIFSNTAHLTFESTDEFLEWFNR